MESCNVSGPFVLSAIELNKSQYTGSDDTYYDLNALKLFIFFWLLLERLLKFSTFFFKKYRDFFIYFSNGFSRGPTFLIYAWTKHSGESYDVLVYPHPRTGTTQLVVFHVLFIARGLGELVKPLVPFVMNTYGIAPSNLLKTMDCWILEFSLSSGCRRSDASCLFKNLTFRLDRFN